MQSDFRSTTTKADSHDTIDVVAAVLTHRGRICLLRRSRAVTGDIGRWHCVTGYLPSGQDPLQQALVEIYEEIGIETADLELSTTAVVELLAADGTKWRVHAFGFESRTDAVTLNWEHDAAYWARFRQIAILNTVAWLDDILAALTESELQRAGL